MKLRSRKQIERAWARGETDYRACPPKHEMGGEARFLWQLAHYLGVIILPMFLVGLMAVVFVWAGVPMMTMCLGTMPVWVTCLLVFMCVYVLPYIFKRK